MFGAEQLPQVLGALSGQGTAIGNKSVPMPRPRPTPSPDAGTRWPNGAPYQLHPPPQGIRPPTLPTLRYPPDSSVPEEEAYFGGMGNNTPNFMGHPQQGSRYWLGPQPPGDASNLLYGPHSPLANTLHSPYATDPNPNMLPQNLPNAPPQAPLGGPVWPGQGV